MTFDDEVLFDAHRRTGMCVSPDRLNLVAVGQVWCRLLAGEQTVAASPVRTRQRRQAMNALSDHDDRRSTSHNTLVTADDCA
ncbi:MAG: hypothetical protein QOG46_358 [Pseudonocardiales bacterium]|jgi:hypothetical protein|nr:hypothetical protein [Pseudonocardiales bacterium]